MRKRDASSQLIGKYLKFLIRQDPDVWIQTKTLSQEFNLHPSTITEVFQLLAKKGLVEYKKYKGIRLTTKGHKEGQLLIRKHRVLEVFFTFFLDLSREEACNEADKIDFFISKEIINKLCILCAHPSKCPCGNEIYHHSH